MCNGFKLLDERAEHYGGGKIEDGMHESNAEGIDIGIGKGEVEDRICAIEQKQADHSADEVKGNVHDTDLLGILGDADGGDDSGYAGADVLTHDDGKRNTVADAAAQSQCLQHCNGSCRGLDDAGNNCAQKNTEDRADERGFEEINGLLENGGIFQTVNAVAHHLHAVHQNGEADADGTDVLVLVLLAHHDHDDADEGNDQGKVFGLEKVDPACALNAGHGENPRGEGRADV